MIDLDQQQIQHLYRIFSSPITHLDCGEKCGAYNENHIPFCCDTRHVIPLAYRQEWEYLKNNTDLWHQYSINVKNSKLLLDKLPENQVLVECLGYPKCQRDFRAITCRSFPFFPYIDHQGKFIGLTYYWEYEDRCWVINHLHTISPQFRDEFVSAFEVILNNSNQEYANFRHQSIIMRRVFGRKKRAILLISRAATPQLQFYKISPKNGRLHKVDPQSLGKHGYYYFAEKLPFPEEIE